MNTSTFPAAFIWGAAASSYQTEGAVHADGRVESIWDRFCSQPGKVRAGESGEVACDFYGRYGQDVRLMQELGLDAFRFSVAWPRVLPAGHGRVNHAGLDFYDRLVDELLAAGIRPFVNLYHWDLPQMLEDAGGWPERGTAEAFAELADVVGSRLGDRVSDWITINEPYCPAWLGYGLGIHAPGRSDPAAALAAAHHLLLGHGWAVHALRAAAPDAEVGIVLDSWPVHPASGRAEDVAAAWAEDGVRNRWFFDAIQRGAYPSDVLERFGRSCPAVAVGDMEAISAPLDFIGVNNYSRRVVEAGEHGEAVDVRVTGAEYTATDWEIYPAGLTEVLVRLHRDYAAPSLYVTESGAAFADTRTHDGRIHDVERIDYLERYIGAVEEALRAGVNVRGYFVWSLLDNFEWALGYAKRFGLVFVDYPTLERFPKESYWWYRNLIEHHRASGDRATRARTARGAAA